MEGSGRRFSENHRKVEGKINAKKIVIKSIEFYQTNISPYLPNTCRFYPSCSEYSKQAISKYGLLKGGIKAIWRILRCNPFSKGGYDPVR